MSVFPFQRTAKVNLILADEVSFKIVVLWFSCSSFGRRQSNSEKPAGKAAKTLPVLAEALFPHTGVSLVVCLSLKDEEPDLDTVLADLRAQDSHLHLLIVLPVYLPHLFWSCLQVSCVCSSSVPRDGYLPVKYWGKLALSYVFRCYLNWYNVKLL